MSSANRKHQPVLGPVEHPRPGAAELDESCGGNVAVVVALSWSATPLTVMYEDPDKEPFTCEEAPRPLQVYEGKTLLATAVETACASRFAAVKVLLLEPGEHEAAAREAIAGAGDGVQVEVLSHADLREGMEGSGYFELFGLSKPVLDAGLGLLAEYPQADGAAFIPCDTPRLAPWHLRELCIERKAHPECDLVYSWICWLARLPLVASRAFLEGLGESPLCRPANNGVDRPVPLLDAREVVFGEERLQANDTASKEHDDFFDAVALSAREAVRMARARAAATGDEAAQLDKGIDALGDADKLLVETAAELLPGFDAARAEEPESLAKWDAWGRRNESDFPLLNDGKHRGRLAYLDSAATSQRLAQAIQAEYDFDTHGNANIYRGLYGLSMGSTAAYNEARASIEGHLGAERRSTVITANTTASAQLVALSWGFRNLKEGDVVLMGLMEHHSNMMPWRMMADACGARFEYIPYLPDGRIDQQEYERLLKLEPRLVCVAHVSNVLGIVNPVEEMAQKAHDVGARFFLDAAQSFPHFRMKVEDLGVDFIAFSGHKAYGPMGVGGLWIGEEAFAETDPVMAGGGSISHVGKEDYYLRAGAIQHELGTPPVAQAIGLAAAIGQLDLVGMEAVEEHSRVLTRFMVRALHLVPGVTVWGDHSAEDGQSGLVTFSACCIPPARFSADMGRLQVCIRAGGQCALPLHAAMGIKGTGRISLGIHNTVEDIEAAVLALTMSVKLVEC